MFKSMNKIELSNKYQKGTFKGFGICKIFGNYHVMALGIWYVFKYLQYCKANVGESQYFSLSDHFALAILPKFAKLPKLAKVF